MTNLVGQQFGNYQLMQLLGQGEISDVYLAKHTLLDHPAAVKLYHRRLDQNSQEIFQRSASALAPAFKLEHPHIVRLLDFWIANEHLFLAMEYAPHGSLRSYHPYGTQLPITTIIGYLRQLANALQYAHNNGVAHGQVRPENVLIGPHGHILLSDFGASLLPFQMTLENKSKDGRVWYMAPEQIRGNLLPASDVYALALMAYEWISGQPPFIGKNAEDTRNQHLHAPPVLLSQKVPGIPADLEQVIMTSLVKDPTRRFARIEAFVRALEQASGVNNSQDVSVVGKLGVPLAMPGQSQPPASVQTPPPTAGATGVIPQSLLPTPMPLEGVRPSGKHAVPPGTGSKTPESEVSSADSGTPLRSLQSLQTPSPAQESAPVSESDTPKRPAWLVLDKNRSDSSLIRGSQQQTSPNDMKVQKAKLPWYHSTYLIIIGLLVVSLLGVSVFLVWVLGDRGNGPLQVDTNTSGSPVATVSADRATPTIQPTPTPQNQIIRQTIAFQCENLCSALTLPLSTTLSAIELNRQNGTMTWFLTVRNNNFISCTINTKVTLDDGRGGTLTPTGGTMLAQTSIDANQTLDQQTLIFSTLPQTNTTYQIISSFDCSGNLTENRVERITFE